MKQPATAVSHLIQLFQVIDKVFEFDGKIRVFNNALFSRPDLNGGEIKNCADAAFLKEMGNPLCFMGRCCYEPDFDAQFFNHF